MLQDLALDPLSLPDGVVGVLNLQLRQRIFPTIAESGVERTQFVSQHAHRPSVGDDMVHGDQQRMLLFRKTNQSAANQRAVFQIEGGAGFQFSQAIKFCPGVAMPTEVVIDQQEAAVLGGAYLLYRLPVDESKCGP